MKDKNHDMPEKAEEAKSDNTMTRKEALVKAGKYAAFTALGMMVVLSPKKSQAQSPAPPGGGPFGG